MNEERYAELKKIVENLKKQGFDTTEMDISRYAYRPGCSQCNVACINGVPCHEQGCPNQVRL